MTSCYFIGSIVPQDKKTKNKQPTPPPHPHLILISVQLTVIMNKAYRGNISTFPFCRSIINPQKYCPEAMQSKKKAQYYVLLTSGETKRPRSSPPHSAPLPNHLPYQTDWVRCLLLPEQWVSLPVSPWSDSNKPITCSHWNRGTPHPLVTAKPACTTCLFTVFLSATLMCPHLACTLPLPAGYE